MVEINEGETYVKILFLHIGERARPDIHDTELINACIRKEEESGSELTQIHAQLEYVLLEFFKPLITLEELESREWTPKELLEIYLGLDLSALELYKYILTEKTGIHAWIKEKIKEVLQDG